LREKKEERRRLTPPPTPSGGFRVDPAQRSVVVLYRPPPSTLTFNETEGLYFQLFREQTAGELSGFFDSVFWTQSVLRTCHAEPAIRHAVIALGALYKTLEKSSESPPGSPSQLDQYNPDDSPAKHCAVAFQQYSAACAAVRQFRPGDSRSHRTTLMASVLLTCFDSFIGHHQLAIEQIQSGLRLLDQLRAERVQAFQPSTEEPVEPELIQMFTRLAIQAKSYDMAFHFPHPYVIRLTGTQSAGSVSSSAGDIGSPGSDTSSRMSVVPDLMPTQFTSLLEARLAWDTLEEKALRFAEILFHSMSSDGPMGVLPSSLRHSGSSFKEQIQNWSDAFDHLLGTRTAPGVTSQEKAGIAVLKMSQIMGQILFAMTFSDNEMLFDGFQPHFQRIVELALEVVGDEERRASAKRCPDPAACTHRHDRVPDLFGGHEYSAYHIKPSFSADLGIVPPLYVVATKCRNPSTRRQAIQLLRSSARREGMWDSELTARIGMWVADIEEEEELITPQRSPMAAHAHAHAPATAATTVALAPGAAYPRGTALGFDENEPLGPGGNARWDARRESIAAQIARQARRTVPEDKRVMVKSVQFDLRERWARLQVGSRNRRAGEADLKTRETRFTW
jgi:hypothetical protein